METVKQKNDFYKEIESLTIKSWEEFIKNVEMLRSALEELVKNPENSKQESSNLPLNDKNIPEMCAQEKFLHKLSLQFLNETPVPIIDLTKKFPFCSYNYIYDQLKDPLVSKYCCEDSSQRKRKIYALRFIEYTKKYGSAEIVNKLHRLNKIGIFWKTQ